MSQCHLPSQAPAGSGEGRLLRAVSCIDPHILLPTGRHILVANDTHCGHAGIGTCRCCCFKPVRALPPALLCIPSRSADSREQRELVAAGHSWPPVALLGAARVALGMRNVVGQLFPWCRHRGSVVLPQSRDILSSDFSSEGTLCMCTQRPDRPVQPVSGYGK